MRVFCHSCTWIGESEDAIEAYRSNPFYPEDVERTLACPECGADELEDDPGRGEEAEAA